MVVICQAVVVILSGSGSYFVSSGSYWSGSGSYLSGSGSCGEFYSDDVFSVLARGRSQLHLAVLETLKHCIFVSCPLSHVFRRKMYFPFICLVLAPPPRVSAKNNVYLKVGY